MLDSSFIWLFVLLCNIPFTRSSKHWANIELARPAN